MVLGLLVVMVVERLIRRQSGMRPLTVPSSCLSSFVKDLFLPQIKEQNKSLFPYLPPSCLSLIHSTHMCGDTQR